MSIFTHVVVGTNDLDQARKFYDAVLKTIDIPYHGPLGENGAIYQSNGYKFIVTKPTNGQPATHANGGTVGFSAPNRDAVHKFHEAGLANGGSCDGKPGPRSAAPNAYAAYLRDPEGNKICTFCFQAE